MAYTPKTWVAGEVITADDLNALENGIADKLPKGIRVSGGVSSATKLGGDASLTVAAYPGDGQFRINHTRGDTNFTVTATLWDDVYGVSDYISLNDGLSIHIGEVTSTYVDVFVIDDDAGPNFVANGIKFQLTLLPD